MTFLRLDSYDVIFLEINTFASFATLEFKMFQILNLRYEMYFCVLLFISFNSSLKSPAGVAVSSEKVLRT